ncbi:MULTISPECIES: peptide deformylase [Pseudanabaena]|uniref:Peptide deformylase n=2 Tax=Pseudanabaena TaxID=1152 RepID=L8N2S4_9CYAN|nr:MULTISPECIES: peptide deformylase [Pseudanabaena]ELS32563.1 Peptide deformylase [Pseudanabaena biceps PCC 7429]MDG3495222.1 peptide deformylase [Pseudanabaena catenata USMAC16]
MFTQPIKLINQTLTKKFNKPLNQIFTLFTHLFTQENPKQSVYQIGNPILRQIAQPIADVSDREIQQLIDAMLVTLKESRGVGLAAPQIGKSLQLLIVASHPNQRYPHAPQMEPTAMINPQIISHSEETEKGWEGCLSVPMIRGLVPRYREIEVAYTDRYGDRQVAKLTDFVARIFQHEYDHLEGKVFLDRVESSLDLASEAEYHKLLQVSKVS